MRFFFGSDFFRKEKKFYVCDPFHTVKLKLGLNGIPLLCTLGNPLMYGLITSWIVFRLITDYFRVEPLQY